MAGDGNVDKADWCMYGKRIAHLKQLFGNLKSQVHSFNLQKENQIRHS